MTNISRKDYFAGLAMQELIKPHLNDIQECNMGITRGINEDGNYQRLMIIFSNVGVDAVSMAEAVITELEASDEGEIA